MDSRRPRSGVLGAGGPAEGGVVVSPGEDGGRAAAAIWGEARRSWSRPATNTFAPDRSPQFSSAHPTSGLPGDAHASQHLSERSVARDPRRHRAVAAKRRGDILDRDSIAEPLQSRIVEPYRDAGPFGSVSVEDGRPEQRGHLHRRGDANRFRRTAGHVRAVLDDSSAVIARSARPHVHARSSDRRPSPTSRHDPARTASVPR